MTVVATLFCVAGGFAAEQAGSSPAWVQSTTEAARMPAAEALQIETVVERYANGKIRARREVARTLDLEYVNHGHFETRDEDGNLTAKGRFEAGRACGEWTRLYQTEDSPLFTQEPFTRFAAPFKSTATFVDGRMQGAWTITDAQDRLVSTIDFADGVREGKLDFYYPDGKTAREITFTAGVIDGLDRTFDSEGAVVKENQYIDGRRYVSETKVHPGTKNKTQEAFFLYPRMQLKTADNWWDASLATWTVGEGSPVCHGPYTAWHLNGQKSVSGNFYDGKAHGDFVWWHANDQISVRGQFVHGKHTGDWHWWHANGMKAGEVTFNEGAPVGRWLTWNDAGKLIRKESFQNGSGAASGDTPNLLTIPGAAEIQLGRTVEPGVQTR
ncbi:MAG: hypothetical protein KDA41_17245 [Planctomycetales bacterium]|nr:hypothetical protein [Planctomycetales bacterium]